MLQSMLVALDGSPHSRSAVELGIQWARPTNALLVGLGIIDEPTITRPQALPIGGSHYKKHRDDLLLAGARRKVEQFLEQFALRCAEVQVACKPLEDVGLPSEAILLEAQRYDLILLGQRTHFHFETQTDPDETLRDVVKNSPRPVVIVPEKPASGSAVVIAYDGSLQAARTLQAFQGLGLTGFQPTHIVSVHDQPNEASRQAQRAAEFLRFHEIAAQPHPVTTARPPAEVILQKAQELGAGLLVMGAYGKSVLHEFFLGSVTKAILKESALPLFLYH